ncbi:MAG: response regulator [Chloroflexi bacterium]|nr:response regulator [Chloroflexota bacterium]
MLANVLKQRLEREGYKVDLAQDGEGAVKLLKSTKPDLMLLDIILPKYSGFEIMEMMRNDPTMAQPSVVIISNLGQESDVLRGQTLGAVGYFIKAQLSVEDLIGKIKEFLNAG